jgi:hypothetical protein
MAALNSLSGNTMSGRQDKAGSVSSATSPLYYLVDWLPPDFGAVGQYGMAFARAFSQSGRRVRLIGLTSGAESAKQEVVAGGGVLEIRRIHAKRYDKSRFVSRMIWTVRTNLRLAWDVVSDPASRRADLLFTGAPPFFLFFATAIKFLRGMRLIYRITDFYPEAIVAERGRSSLALAFLERVTWFMRRRVDAFEVLGEDQRRRLIKGGIAADRIVLKRDTAPIEISGRESPAIRPTEVAGRNVLLYSGNYGVPHDVDTVVEGLIHHHRFGSGKFALWLNAAGSNVELVETRLRAANVPVARTTPVPLDKLPATLAAADVQLVTLRTPFSGIVLPSKIYGCIASRRPILFVGPATSDVHLLCTQATNIVYERIEPADFEGFADALERLAQSVPTVECACGLGAKSRSGRRPQP